MYIKQAQTGIRAGSGLGLWARWPLNWTPEPKNVTKPRQFRQLLGSIRHYPWHTWHQPDLVLFPFPLFHLLLPRSGTSRSLPYVLGPLPGSVGYCPHYQEVMQVYQELACIVSMSGWHLKPPGSGASPKQHSSSHTSLRIAAGQAGKGVIQKPKLVSLNQSTSSLDFWLCAHPYISQNPHSPYMIFEGMHLCILKPENVLPCAHTIRWFLSWSPVT